MTSDEGPAREILTYELFGTAVRELRTERWIDFPWSSTPPLADRRGGLAH